MKVNGKDYPFKENMTIDNLLSEMNFDKECIVVEMDRDIIPKADFYKKKVKEDSVIEVISFVGGGWLFWKYY